MSHTGGGEWLITRRGFGLDTGFIHYGDYTPNGYTGYNYWDHYHTGSFSDPTDGTTLHWHLTSRTELTTHFDSGDRLTLTNFGGRLPKTEKDWLKLSVASSIEHLGGPIENLAFQQSVAICSFLTCPWSSPSGGWSPAVPAAHRWSNPGGGWSPAASAAPSLRPVVSSGSLMRCGRYCVPIHFYFFNIRGTDA
jgi:hypothetical protein